MGIRNHLLKCTEEEDDGGCEAFFFILLLSFISQRYFVFNIFTDRDGDDVSFPQFSVY